MQLAAPPIYPNAPVTDRGFTGPGGANGGQRRRLAGRHFDRQHSVQDPMVDPVTQRYGRQEVPSAFPAQTAWQKFIQLHSPKQTPKECSNHTISSGVYA